MATLNFARILSYTAPFNRDALWLKARSIPSLDLDFATNKSLIDRISGQNLITFTRSSSATYVDSDGLIKTALANVPRFQHNPTTGRCLGLLVEEQRQNLRSNSEAILAANGYSISTASLASSSIQTPAGGTSGASLLTPDSGADTGNSNAGTCNFGSGLTLTNSTVHTSSVFVKGNGVTVLRLRNNAAGGTHDFTLTGSGTAPSLTAELQGATIQAFPNGWYRCSWTYTTKTSAPGNRGDYWGIKTDVADGTAGLYLYGAQLEAGAFPTSYIPTTGTSATRSADIATVTSTAFSGWYNQGQGSLYYRAALGGIGSQNYIAALDAGAGFANSHTVYCLSGTPRYDVFVSSVAQSQLTPAPATSVSAGAAFDFAYAYAANDFSTSRSGGAVSTDAAGTLPSISRLVIGSNGTSFQANGPISRLVFWPQRLPNHVLQALTR